MPFFSIFEKKIIKYIINNKGSGSWAFYDVYPNSEHIIACEPSKVMRKAGKHMTQDIDKVIWIDMLAQTAVYDHAKSFDIVYCGYVMEEAKSAEGIYYFHIFFFFF